MFDSIRSYFVRNVLANYKSYRNSIEEKETGVHNDLRLAINAATSLYHMREHMPKSHQKSRAEIAKICSNYDLLGDVVNASKHQILDRGDPKLNSAEKIEEIVLITEYEDEKGKYYDAEKKIIAHLKDGSEVDIDKILRDVANFWVNEMNKLGYDFSKIKPIKRMIPPPRQSESGAAPMSIRHIKGEDFKHKMVFQIYDEETGKFVPKDLTDHKFEMNVYKPKFEGVVTITNDETGEEYKITIPITAEQQKKISNIEDDEIRNIYLNKILKKSEHFKKRMEEIFGE